MRIAGITFTIIIITGFAFRNPLLRYGFEKAQTRLLAKGLKLSCQKLAFTGFSGISMQQTTIASVEALQQPILQCDSMSVYLSPIRGILGFGWINEVEVAQLNLHYHDSNPYFAKAKKGTPDKSKPTKEQTPNGLLSLLKEALQQLPQTLRADFLTLQIDQGLEKNRIRIEALSWEDEKLSAEIGVQQKQRVQQFRISGDLNRQSLEGNLLMEGRKDAPVLISLMGGDFGFSRMQFQLDQISEKKEGLNIQASCEITNAYIDHRRISDTVVRIDAIQGNPIINLRKGSIEIDSSSRWMLNTFAFNAGIHYPIKDSMAAHWAYLNIDMEAGSQLFQSLPAGLFRYTSGISVAGSFAHRFYLWYTPRKLSQTKFEADITYSPDFKVLQWGKAQPEKLNGSFHHDYYDGDRWEAGFEVGPSNPLYTPISQISPNLIESTLKAEDPSYYGHKGFYLEAFREALIANVREKRFARGGSTLSMQLVKNVFLRQHKTLTRKIEEIMLVWLIEHERTVSKQRMLEVYFNIIEWGPGVFGVGSASRFYFGKAPSQLNMGESCYLSSLIPAPSKARWSVDSAGQVSPRWSRYTKLKNRIMRGDSTRFGSADFDFTINAFN